MEGILGRVISVSGKRGVIIRDEAGAFPTDSADLLVDDKLLGDGHKLWASTRAMNDVVEKNANIPIYGLWQTLLSMGAVDTENYRLFTIETEANGDGQYLLKLPHGWMVGVTIGGEFEGLPEEEELTEADIQVISLDVKDLTFPESRILNPSERAALQRKENRLFYRRLLTAVSFVFSIFFAVGLYLSQKADEKDLEYKNMKELRDSLQATVDLLKYNRSTAHPDQKDLVMPLWYLSHTLPQGSFKAEAIRLTTGQGEVVVKKEFAHAAYLLPSNLFDVRMKVEGEAIVTWQVAP